MVFSASCNSFSPQEHDLQAFFLEPTGWLAEVMGAQSAGVFISSAEIRLSSLTRGTGAEKLSLFQTFEEFSVGRLRLREIFVPIGVEKDISNGPRNKLISKKTYK